MKSTQAFLDPQADQNQIAEHINSALESDDLERIHQAIGEATKLFNMTELAKIADIQRESLYRSFGGRSHANLTTVIKVLSAMGLQLRVLPVSGSKHVPRSGIARRTT